MQSLAAEVVALEEKVLQTRSREMRLQKGTDSLQEGLQQAEKQLQASRQDRANLQSTIDMLQVRKGLPVLRGRATWGVGGAFQGAGGGKGGWGGVQDCGVWQGLQQAGRQLQVRLGHH